MSLLASTAGDILDYALAVFFVASGLGLAYMLVRLGGTFGRLSSFLRGSERDLLPVFVKAGGTVDRVNDQLDKLDTVTDSAVSMPWVTAMISVNTATWSGRSSGTRKIGVRGSRYMYSDQPPNKCGVSPQCRLLP